MLKDIIFILLFILAVATVLLGIWWEPFPFWKVIGTIIVLILLYRIFFSK